MFSVAEKDLAFITTVGEGAYGEVWKGKWNGKGGGITVAIKKVKVISIPPIQRTKIIDEVGILLE